MADYIRTIRKKIGHDPLMICGASVIVYKDGSILLQKRKDNGFYGYPGGCVELYEEVEHAAARELFEETGLTAVSLELFGVFSGEDMAYTYPNKDQVSVVDIVFVCTEFTGEVITATDETTDCLWFGIDNLPENINPTNIRPIQDFVRKQLEKEKG
ncbi:MAG: NUDIX domain-containing protein [Dehalococcoidales bacterium]|nr:NUDIX domain-containing protein [Dehalococcoidales bacterium]